MIEEGQATQDEILKRFFDAQDGLVIQAADLSLGSLAEMVNSSVIDIEPTYQRRHRWSPHKQSALIESFLLNIPVPPIYLAEDRLGRYSVVDGKQRLTAIADFISGRLRLTQLESFQQVQGLIFSELPEELQNALSIRPYLRIITILKQSSPLLKYEVFVRLNRGGERMEPQELRNVAFRGPLNDLIYTLAGNEFLKGQLKIKNEKSPAYQVMADAELVLRFLALRGVWRRLRGGLREVMDSFMSDHQHASPPELSGFQSRFERAIEGCRGLWGPHAFQRPATTGYPAWRSQLLNGMYDAQMLAVDELTNDQLQQLIGLGNAVSGATRSLFEDYKFDRSIREATNTPGRLKHRVSTVLSTLTALI